MIRLQHAEIYCLEIFDDGGIVIQVADAGGVSRYFWRSLWSDVMVLSISTTLSGVSDLQRNTTSLSFVTLEVDRATLALCGVTRGDDGFMGET